MKTKQFLLTVLLSLIGVANSFADEWTDSDGNVWSFEITDEVNHLVSLKGLASGTNAIVPGSIFVNDEEYSVSSIAAGAFFNQSNILSVSELANCKSIGNNAFCRCSSLLSVENLPSCLSIGAGAFEECTSLKSVGDLPLCESIGDLAFAYCTSLERVGDMHSCKELDNQVFRNCNKLQSIGALTSCELFGDYTFNGCSSLRSIGDLPQCKRVVYGAFGGCSSLESIGNLPSCTYLGEGAFTGCSSLRCIGDLSNCTSVNYYAFSGCSSLEGISLPNVTELSYQAFSYCYSLKSITLGSNIPTVKNNTVNTTTLGDFPGTFLVPANAVDNYANADYWRDYTQRIISKDAITEYESNVVLQENASGLFAAIGEQNLKNVMSLKVNGEINSYDIFTIRNKMPNLHVLDLSNAVIKANPYKYYSYYSTEDDELPPYCFYGKSNLVDVKLPHSIVRIGSSAFEECSCLRNIEIYNGVSRIGSKAFRNCDNLKTLAIPKGVLYLYDQTFWSCEQLENISLPSTLTEIGGNVFYSCFKLKSIDLPNSLKLIGRWAFQSCLSLSEIALPPSLCTIEAEAFVNCNALRTIRVSAVDPNSVKLADNSFSAISNKTLYIPYDEETGWDATYNAYYWHTQWGQFGTLLKWKPTYENVYINNDYDQSAGTIPGENIDAEFDNQSGYILGDAAEQEFNDVHIKNDGTNGGSIIADDNLNINKLYCEINVQADRWYFFCFPFDVQLSDIEAPGEYVFRLYDGNERANGNAAWKNLALDDSYLKAGKGYIFQTNTAGTLLVPVDNPKFTAEGKSASLETHASSNKHNASWNFIGNPYLSYYEIDNLGHNAPITYWNGYGYTAVRPGDDDYALQPYQAFFVQKTTSSDEVGFDKDGRETYNQSLTNVQNAKARRAKAKINPERLLLNVTITDGKTVDQTRVVFNDKQLMEYETECDASKFMSTENVPQLYTYYNNVNYAINERPNGSGEVQLCFKAPKDGVYTISMTRMDTPMLLKDAETGTTFDFQNGDYTFEAVAGTNTTRFLLVKNNSADAIQPVTVGDAESAEFWNAAGQKTSADAKGVKIVKTESGVKKVLTK